MEAGEGPSGPDPPRVHLRLSFLGRGSRLLRKKIDLQDSAATEDRHGSGKLVVLCRGDRLITKLIEHRPDPPDGVNVRDDVGGQKEIEIIRRPGWRNRTQSACVSAFEVNRPEQDAEATADDQPASMLGQPVRERA